MGSKRRGSKQKQRRRRYKVFISHATGMSITIGDMERCGTGDLAVQHGRGVHATKSTRMAATLIANRRRASRGGLHSSSDSPLLREFLVYIASERGLADNSIAGYRRDVEDLQRYLIAHNNSLLCRDPDVLRGYLQNQTRRGQSTRTVARRLAAIRIFLRFRQATRGEEVTALLDQLERPKPERSLPKILSRAQVNQLIASPN